jgi:actin-like ATPase involved in cell morphogenesis
MLSGLVVPDGQALIKQEPQVVGDGANTESFKALACHKGTAIFLVGGFPGDVVRRRHRPLGTGVYFDAEAFSKCLPHGSAPVCEC